MQLTKGEVRIADKTPAPTVREFSTVFMKQIEMERKGKPATILFYQRKLNSLLENSGLADVRLNEIDQSAILMAIKNRSELQKGAKRPLLWSR
jgi:hypothetical protein